MVRHEMFFVKLSQWKPEQSAIKANNKVKITKNKKIRRIHTFRIQLNNEIDFEMSLSAHYSAWHHLHQPLAIVLFCSLRVFSSFITRCHHLCYYLLQRTSKWPKNSLGMTSKWLELTKVWSKPFWPNRLDRWKWKSSKLAENSYLWVFIMSMKNFETLILFSIMIACSINGLGRFVTLWTVRLYQIYVSIIIWGKR